MIVVTKHGDFDCKDITRKERRMYYREVKEVFASGDDLKLHDMADKFAEEIAFDDADKSLKGLSAIAEDEVLIEIIKAYMGLELGNSTGD